MADKIFDASNPTPSASAASATPANDGPQAATTTDVSGGSPVGVVNAAHGAQGLQPAIADAHPKPTGSDHVPTTNDASYCASGAVADGEHPAWPNGVAPLGANVQVADDPAIVGEKSEVVGIDFATWRHVSGVRADQLAGFAQWAGSRHGAARFSSNRWAELYEHYKAQVVK